MVSKIRMRKELCEKYVFCLIPLPPCLLFTIIVNTLIMNCIFKLFDKSKNLLKKKDFLGPERWVSVRNGVFCFSFPVKLKESL